MPISGVSEAGVDEKSVGHPLYRRLWTPGESSVKQALSYPTLSLLDLRNNAVHNIKSCKSGRDLCIK